MAPQRQPDTRPVVILVVVALACLLTALAPPLAQWPDYHDFADQRRLLGIPNFSDVVSSSTLMIVAVFCLLQIRNIIGDPRHISAAVLFFTCIGLIAIGSAYYHLAPSNDTLLWDRLPIAAALMAFMALVIGEFISSRAGAQLLLPLVALGLGSAGYWYFSELQGQGDLRPYALVQFLPFVLIPLILWLYGARLAENRHLLVLLCWLLLARVFELLDVYIYEFTGFVSGHTLKHLASALGVYSACQWLKKDRRHATP